MFEEPSVKLGNQCFVSLMVSMGTEEMDTNKETSSGELQKEQQLNLIRTPWTLDTGHTLMLGLFHVAERELRQLEEALSSQMASSASDC